MGDQPALHVEESGQGEILVFLPGFSVSSVDYPSLRQRLSQHYRVVSIDLPGSGKSGPQPRTYTRHYFEDDAATISAHIRSLTSSPVPIMGHSDGGEVALMIAARHGDLARSVVTWGAAGAVVEMHRGAIAFFHNIVDHPPADSVAYREYLVNAYGEANAQAMTQSFATALTSILEDDGDISLKSANRIACPVLLIAGEHDIFAPKALIDDYAKRVPSAKTMEVAGGGHDLHLTHVEWLADTALRWFQAN